MPRASPPATSPTPPRSPSPCRADTPELVAAVVEGHRLGGYTFTALQVRRSPRPPSPATSSCSPPSRARPTPSPPSSARRSSPTPSRWPATGSTRRRGDCTPPLLADARHGRAQGGHQGPRCAQGEARGVRPRAARRARLRRHPRRRRLLGRPAAPGQADLGARRTPSAHLALVGKGITFDSGGLTIKPRLEHGQHEGRHGRRGRRRRRPPSRSPGSACRSRSPTFAPMAENMVVGHRDPPRRRLTMYGGTTVEIANTDAEGRMLLGDALSLRGRGEARRGRRRRHPHRPHAAGARRQGRRPSWAPTTRCRRVLAAAEAAGEQHWPMPIPEEMKERITSSKVADLLQHDWVRWGGGLYASAFLREFTGGLPWAHLDIAGHGDQHRRPLRPRARRAPPASAVTTLVEIARSVAARPVRGTDPARLAGAAVARLRCLRPSCAGCSRASAAGCRPPRRRTTAPGGGWRSRAPTSRSAPAVGSTRRRGRPAAGSRR